MLLRLHSNDIAADDFSDLGADADDSIMLISVCTDSCRGGVVKDPG